MPVVAMMIRNFFQHCCFAWRNATQMQTALFKLNDLICNNVNSCKACRIEKGVDRYHGSKFVVSVVIEVRTDAQNTIKSNRNIWSSIQIYCFSFLHTSDDDTFVYYLLPK